MPAMYISTTVSTEKTSESSDRKYKKDLEHFQVFFCTIYKYIFAAEQQWYLLFIIHHSKKSSFKK